MGRVRILGVRHDDRRLPGELGGFVPEEVDSILHEVPEDFSGAADRVSTALLYQPTILYPGLLFDLLGRRSSRRVAVHSWCERAAREVAEERCLPFHGVGMNVEERVRAAGLTWSLFSWLFFSAAVVGPVAPLLAPSAFGPSLPGVLASAVGGPLLAAAYSAVYARHLLPVRERGMLDNLERLVRSEGYSFPALVVGEDHVEPMRVALEERGVEVSSVEVSSRLDARG